MKPRILLTHSFLTLSMVATTVFPLGAMAHDDDKAKIKILPAQASINAAVRLAAASDDRHEKKQEKKDNKKNQDPKINNLRVTNITETSAMVRWHTNKNATTQVWYGTTLSYGLTSPLLTKLIKQHSVFLTGLKANTTYHFQVRSVDASGNVATSADTTLTTSSDLRAPVLSVISVSDVTSTSATIKWTTNEEADSEIYYSSATPLNLSLATRVENATLVKAHSMTLTGLSAGTTYQFVLASVDASGNLSISAVLSLKTQ